MTVISRTQEEYITEFVTRYQTSLAVGVEDVLLHALHQESCVKDLKWPHQQLVEVKATVMKYLG